VCWKPWEVLDAVGGMLYTLEAVVLYILVMLEGCMLITYRHFIPLLLMDYRMLKVLEVVEDMRHVP
jgi:hypothetical protein